MPILDSAVFLQCSVVVIGRCTYSQRIVRLWRDVYGDCLSPSLLPDVCLGRIYKTRSAETSRTTFLHVMSFGMGCPTQSERRSEAPCETHVRPKDLTKKSPGHLGLSALLISTCCDVYSLTMSQTGPASQKPAE